MADDEVPVFDPTMKKKKKKKSTEDAPVAEDAQVAEAAAGVAEVSLDDPTADFGKKKKKKKPKAEEGEEGAEGAPAEEGDLGALPTKKKKKKKTLDTESLEDLEAAFAGGAEDDQAAVEEDSASGSSGLPWEGSSRDYHYEELLGRVFGMLRENNPELAGEKQKTILKPPQVLREGTKKTVFVNFMELCKTMHRQPDHVMGYLHAELGTSGSLDGQQRLIMKGRFTPKVFEGILRRYVNEYVICNMCKSTDTLLSREQRLFMLRCQQCGASRSVGAIKTGFVAQIGRRKRAEV
mmetsp:Transcript_36309/g.43888  ORF Transcript_36309/g.43888 Transcript_36309/m.43888 type:complete len:293 (+) Transcript_36309:121-999(+)|eukprot:CAMPEP_0197848214 /NCGR_PEP_ID=MMETSP1438-20131217/7986_1 /TAXON_ID=1461541 /ORGANISM="Pterosperma sp., Strain CCMP1384" /LENGTH=292 /DNA_ID=CAMNT_0043460357 /DNA_START=116 /DNA_END=994 /DNA_ORIENTATION=+